MKLKILCAFMLFFISLNGYTQPGIWQTVQTNPGVLMLDMYFLNDGLNGWSVGSTSAAGEVISGVARTSNGGTNWIFEKINVFSALQGVFFANQSKGWTVGTGGTILYTTDGGINWTSQNSGTSRQLSKVYFLNESTGWVVGGWNNDGPDYLVLKTTDGGQNWINQSFTGPGYSTESVYFINAQTGLIGCRDNMLNPKIFKTTNGGTNWVSTTIPALGSNLGILSIKFGTENKGWAATTSINNTGPVLYTSDGGNNWVVQTNTGLHYHVLDVKDSNSIAVVAFKVLGGQTEKVFVSSNGGNNWNNFTPPVSNYTYGISYRGNNIWIASDASQILRSSNNGINWQLQNQALRLKSISWSSINTGWTTYGSSVGNDGFTLKTTNGGTNWLPVPNAPGGSQVYFKDENYGWMFFEGNSSTIYRTTNAGVNWIQSSISSGGAWIGKVFFADQNTGWGFGASGKIVNTTNGGITWTPQNSGVSNYVETLFFINSSEGWAGGGYGGVNGFILHTTNGGSTWTQQTPALNNHLTDLNFLNNFTGWALCYSGKVQRTTDGGVTWTAAGSISQFYTSRILMQNESTGWLSAYNQTQSSGTADGRGFIYKTINGGDTWVQEWTGLLIKSDIFNMNFQGNNRIWAVGNHSTILKYEIPVGITSNEEIISDYRLFQNYPNPFNPATSIKFALPKQGLVTLKIYDMFGREIRTLVNEIKSAGNYSVDFNASELSSGIYFYKLKTNDFSDVRKMILVK